jgi:hypothetical protein
MGKRLALSTAVVVIAPAIGWVASALVLRVVPGAQLGSGFVEATPAHVLAFEVTFVFVSAVSALVGLVAVWRRR